MSFIFKQLQLIYLLIYLQECTLSTHLIAIWIIDCVVLGLHFILPRINLGAQRLACCCCSRFLLVLLQIRLQNRIVIVVIIQVAVMQLMLLLRMVHPRGHVGEQLRFPPARHTERRQMEAGKGKSSRCCCMKRVQESRRVLLGFSTQLGHWTGSGIRGVGGRQCRSYGRDGRARHWAGGRRVGRFNRAARAEARECCNEEGNTNITTAVQTEKRLLTFQIGKQRRSKLRAQVRGQVRREE